MTKRAEQSDEPETVITANEALAATPDDAAPEPEPYPTMPMPGGDGESVKFHVGDDLGEVFWVMYEGGRKVEYTPDRNLVDVLVSDARTFMGIFGPVVAPNSKAAREAISMDEPVEDAGTPSMEDDQ